MALLRELCQGPQPEWESRCKTNAGEDPEKWEAVLIVDGNVSWSRKSVWRFLWFLNDNLWPGCPIPGHILKGLYIPQCRHLYIYAHRCSHHTHWETESISMPINWWPNKRGMVNTYKGIQLGTKEKLKQDLQGNGQKWEMFYIRQSNPGLGRGVI